MKKLSIVLTVTAIILLSAFTFKTATNWNIDEEYSIKFTSKDPSGVFTKMSGDIAFDPDNIHSSKFDVKVDVNSINTGNGTQNKHAKSKKWFDAETYPYIHFVSREFRKTDKGYEVSGTLSMHGITKDFTMPFTFKNNVFRSSYNINRFDFDLGSDKGMSGSKVPAELLVEISVPVSK